MASAHDGHNGKHGLQYLGALATLVGTLVAIGGAFAAVTYNMGQLAQRVTQAERELGRLEETAKETQKENNFRITILERKAGK